MKRIILIVQVILVACSAPLTVNGKRLSYKRAEVDGTKYYLIQKSVAPTYPDALRAEGVEGFVVLKLDISKLGIPENVEVFRSEPPGIFGQYAIDAAKQWKYLPAEQNGTPVVARNVRTLLTFCVDKSDPAPQQGHDICRGEAEKRSILSGLPKSEAIFEP